MSDTVWIFPQITGIPAVVMEPSRAEAVPPTGDVKGLAGAGVARPGDLGNVEPIVVVALRHCDGINYGAGLTPPLARRLARIIRKAADEAERAA